MKLLTHNFLTSRAIKGVKVGYPLKIEATKMETKAFEYNEEVLANMLPKLEWEALVFAAESLEQLGDLPKQLPEPSARTPEFYKALHRVLYEVEVEEGALECPETGRKFPIKNGIPNMLLNEDEVVK